MRTHIGRRTRCWDPRRNVAGSCSTLTDTLDSPLTGQRRRGTYPAANSFFPLSVKQLEPNRAFSRVPVLTACHPVAMLRHRQGRTSIGADPESGAPGSNRLPATSFR